VVICDTPSAGHDTVMLDYTDCAVDGEPAVAYIDEDRVPRRVAASRPTPPATSARVRDTQPTIQSEDLRCGLHSVSLTPGGTHRQGIYPPSYEPPGGTGTS